jgi:hypothetical protein
MLRRTHKKRKVIKRKTINKKRTITKTKNKIRNKKQRKTYKRGGVISRFSNINVNFFNKNEEEFLERRDSLINELQAIIDNIHLRIEQNPDTTPEDIINDITALNQEASEIDNFFNNTEMEDLQIQRIQDIMDIFSELNTNNNNNNNSTIKIGSIKTNNMNNNMNINMNNFRRHNNTNFNNY